MKTAGRGSRAVDAGLRRTSQNSSASSSSSSTSPPGNPKVTQKLRGLPPNELGGVIFFCNNGTMGECLSKKLFGLPSHPHWDHVQHIRKGLLLFLYNQHEKKMYGGFEAECEGRKNIDPTAWTTNGAGITLYAAQVKFREKRKCNPISDEVFREHFRVLYFSKSRFMCELTHREAEKLDTLFETLPPSPTDMFSGPKVANASYAWLKAVSSGTGIDKTSESGINLSSLLLEPKAGSSEESKAQLVVKEEEPNAVQDCLVQKLDVPEKVSKGTLSLGESQLAAEEHLVAVEMKFPEITLVDERSGVGAPSQELQATNAESRMPLDTSCAFLKVESTGKIEDFLVIKSDDYEVRGNTEHTNVFLEGDNRALLQVGVSEAGKAGNSPAETEQKTQSFPKVEWEKLQQNLLSDDSSSEEKLRIFAAVILQMREDILELKQENLELKLLLTAQQHGPQAGMEYTKASLPLEMGFLKLQQTEEGFLECSTTKTEARDNDPAVPLKSSSNGGDLYVVGGCNGDSWLEAVDVFSPVINDLSATVPMPSLRQCGATSSLDGCIYVFGGVNNDSSYYDTVERYDSRSHQWMSCASMTVRRGCLAGVTEGDRIYAIGGINESKELPVVEYYDACCGVWLPCPSMLEKRSAFAAIELDGVLYAVGGFADRKYICTMERFDRREPHWTCAPQMDTKRGGLSAAVLNGKIYALGGFDGTNFLNSVDIFDPRANKWFKGQSMGSRRAYGAAAVVDNNLYVIGGLHDTQGFVDSMEQYTDGVGWQLLGPAIIGKRSWFSACIL